MRDIATFDVDDVRACSEAIRASGNGARTMEEAAQRIVRYLYDELGDGKGNRACALVRLYKTHPYARLEPALQEFASEALGEQPGPDVRCLTLLATAGDEPAWNDRRHSSGHRAIPLPAEQMVLRLPMVTQLITQLGLDVASVVRPEAAELRALSQRTYDVFHVPEAEGSPHLPAQDEFVRPYGIRSALGFGGMLYTGDFYAVVLFAKVPVPAAAAQLLKILALAVRVPLLALVRNVFAAAA
jgi:hypothetical protein